MLTPYHDDLSVNYQAYEEYADWQVSQGVEHLFAVCGSSEMAELKLEERLKLAELTVKHKGSTTVVATANMEPSWFAQVEPFVGLDPKAAFLLKEMMREVCDRGGAIFFSTHVLEVAEKLCDKVAIIKQGRLIRSGTMDEVRGDDSLEEVFLELEAEEC